MGALAGTRAYSFLFPFHTPSILGEALFLFFFLSPLRQSAPTSFPLPHLVGLFLSPMVMDRWRRAPLSSPRAPGAEGNGADSLDQQAPAAPQQPPPPPLLPLPGSRSRLGSAGSAAPLFFPSLSPSQASTATAGGARGPPRPIRAARPWATAGAREGERATPPSLHLTHAHPLQARQSRRRANGSLGDERRSPRFRARTERSVSSSSSSFGRRLATHKASM